MKKSLSVLLFLSFLGGSLQAADCGALIAQYNAPDPGTKTMKQIKRWVKRKVKDGNKQAIEECMIAGAADNPNKETVAGK
jgi:hypothetical protein